MPISYHTPVLVREVLEYLHVHPNGIYVDGTLGGGGHAREIARLLAPGGTLVCFDLDADALAHARRELAGAGARILFVRDNFRNLRIRLYEHGITRINGLLLDLGVSSHQIDEAGRGFSFQAEGRIDMRMSQAQRLDGWTVVNTWTMEELTGIFREYGEERNARRIARRIVDAREERTIETTAQLAWLVQSVVGAKVALKTNARIFQAIRIAVNDELDNLRLALSGSLEMLAAGGRMVVISYHSLEDRIVKQLFREEARTVIPSGHKLVPDTVVEPRLALLTGKPVEASEEERAENPRSRSAKLRAAERVNHGT